MDIDLDQRGVAYAEATSPSRLAWEGIGGTILIAANWGPEAESSAYKPEDAVLAVKHVVVSAFLDEIVAACLSLSRRKSSSFSLVVHGTPIELALEVNHESAEVKILEYVDYSDRTRTLGTLVISRNDLFQTVAEVVEKFAKRLASANPAMEQNSGFLSFTRQAISLRKQVT